MSSPQSHSWRPYAALVLGVIGLGFSGILVKWANAPGVVSGFYRMLFATLIMALPFGWQVKKEGKPLARRYIGFAILAGLFFAGDLGTWNTAVLMSNAANATLFGNAAPLWVALASWLIFKQKLSGMFWVGLVLALIGGAVILGESFTKPQVGLGDVLAIVASTFYAGFFFATQRARVGLNALAVWWISVATTTIVLLIVSQALGQPLFGYPANTYWNLLALALITQVGAYLAVNYALGHLPASLVSPTLLGQPVLTALLAVPLLGEPISVLQIVGGLLVLSGIAIVHRGH
jgi:drug/metabolite transporter (DMT)-like permease